MLTRTDLVLVQSDTQRGVDGQDQILISLSPWNRQPKAGPVHFPALQTSTLLPSVLPAVLPSSPHSHPTAPPSAGHRIRPLPAGPSPSGSLPGWLPHFAGPPLPEQSWRPVHAPSSSHVLSCFIHSTNCVGAAFQALSTLTVRLSPPTQECPGYRDSLRLGPGDTGDRLHSPRPSRGNRPHVGSHGALCEAHSVRGVGRGQLQAVVMTTPGRGPRTAQTGTRQTRPARL